MGNPEKLVVPLKIITVHVESEPEEEKTQIVSYCHNFRRYFKIGHSKFDRLELILKYGILSPRQAEFKRIPFRRNLNLTVNGVRNYDDMIFLFPVYQPTAIPFWEDSVTVLLKRNLKVLTVEEMTQYQKGNWTSLAPLFGEVYQFGSISPEYFEEILLPSKDEVEKVKELVKVHLPDQADQVRIRNFHEK